MTIIKLFTSCHGRIGRLAYLLGILSLFVVNLVVILMLRATGLHAKMPLAYLFIVLVLNYPGWMIGIKRAHDLGKSGWWLAGWAVGGLLLAVGFLVLGQTLLLFTNPIVALIAVLTSMACSLSVIWQCFVKLHFYRGTPGVNAFGPPDQLLRQLFPAEDLEDPAMPAYRRAAQAAPATGPAQRPAIPATRPARSIAAAAPAPAGVNGFGRRGAKPA